MRYFKFQSLVVLLLSISSILSCGSGHTGGNISSSPGNSATGSSSSGTVPTYDNSFTKGKVIDSIACKDQGTQNFALYLPSYYTSSKQFPCIYIFDAHARGALPLRMYKDIAEKYGFVLIGSNISKNGTQWDATNDGIKVLMDDTRSRINIDNKRIYTAGFSGGSRVASSVAILDGGVAGVIGCAMGFPQIQNPFRNKFDYFGIIGDYDFNLADMMQLNDVLAQQGFSHQVLTFNGKHEWPPVADFELAMLWMQSNAMKEGRQPMNDSVIVALKNAYISHITAAEKTGDLVKQHNLLSGMIAVLDGVADVSVYKKKDEVIINNAGYKTALTAQNQLLQAEMNEQQDLAGQFTTQDEAWWTARITSLKATNRTSTKNEILMNKRLVNFLGLLGYLSSSHALNVGDMKSAMKYLDIFKLADPQNPDCSYLFAVYYSKNGDQKKALAYLDQASSLGYSDIIQLTTDPAFNNLTGNSQFASVVNKVNANRSK